MNSNQKKTVLVEFVGLPCCGKSTLTDRLSMKLENKTNLCIDTPIKNISNKNTSQLDRFLTKSIKSTLFSFHFPLLSYESSKRISKLNWKNKQRIINLLLYSGFIHYEYQCNWRDSKIKIFDQGLFQLLWSIYYSSSHNGGYDNVIENTINETDIDCWIIVNIKTKLPVIVDRIKKRKNRKSSLNINSLNKADGLFDTIKKKEKYYANNSKNITILNIKNNDKKDIRKNVEKIYSKVSV